MPNVTGKLTLKVEKDGGVCALCGCAILKGDLVYVDPEMGEKEHVCCRRAREKPVDSGN